MKTLTSGKDYTFHLQFLKSWARLHGLCIEIVMNKAYNPRFRNWNWTGLIRVLENFQEITNFYKTFCKSISKSVHVHFNRFRIFLLTYCLMVWWWLQMKGPLLANVSKKRKFREILPLISRIWSIFEIFQISLPIKSN